MILWHIGCNHILARIPPQSWRGKLLKSRVILVFLLYLICSRDLLFSQLVQPSLLNRTSWVRNGSPFQSPQQKLGRTTEPSGVLLPWINLSSQRSPWQWLNPIPQGNDLFGIKLFHAQTAVVVGSMGNSMRTANQGETWQIVEDKTIGWKSPYRAVAFCDSLTGVAVRDNGLMLRTTDGGLSWNNLEGIPEVGGLSSIVFLDEKNGMAAGNVIIRTRDAGMTWSVEKTAKVSNYLLCISMGDSNHAIAAGMKGVIVTTSNGGVSWTSSAPDTNLWIVGIAHRTPLDAFGVVQSIEAGTIADKIIHSTNGGLLDTKPFTCNFEAIAFYDSSRGLAVGQDIGGSSVFSTSDGGKNWLSKNTLIGSEPHAISFCGATTAAVAGINGEVFLTTDLGDSWKSLTHGPRGNLFGIAFGDRRAGIAVGSDIPNRVDIWPSTDGGLSWTGFRTNPMEDIFAVAFADSTKATAVGDEGKIWGTTDAGKTWTHQDHPKRFIWLFTVKFLNERFGVLAGDSCVCYKTSDGGEHWSLMPNVGSSSKIMSLDILDTLNICAVGTSEAGPVTLRTSDGGLSWTEQVIH